MLMSTTASSFFSSKPLPLPRIPTLSRPQLISTRHASIFSSNSKAWATKTTINASSSESQTVSVAPSVESASDVVRSFYGGINGHDMGSVEELIAENCVYEDLIFSRPFVGRKAILEFFNKFIDTIRKDLQFVIDDISNEDSFAIGITWHLEWKGKTFPFSKGCSFYRLAVVNGKRQIIYGRDSVCSQAWGGGFGMYARPTSFYEPV